SALRSATSQASGPSRVTQRLPATLPIGATAPYASQRLWKSATGSFAYSRLLPTSGSVLGGGGLSWSGAMVALPAGWNGASFFASGPVKDDGEGRGSAEDALEVLPQGARRPAPGEGADLLAGPEDLHGRQSEHAVRRCGRRVLVGVERDDAEPAVELGRDPL